MDGLHYDTHREYACKYIKSYKLLIFYFFFVYPFIIVRFEMEDSMFWVIIFASLVFIGVFVSLRSSTQSVDNEYNNVYSELKGKLSPRFDKSKLMERVRRRKIGTIY